jgi:hypothetical protein
MLKARGRTAKCDEGTRKGRLDKAKQFSQSAETIAAFADDEQDLIDSYVTLCIHAGIAASDVICCALLGNHAQGDSHVEAVQLLRTVRPELAKDLDVLLRMKTRTEYGAEPASLDQKKQAQRASARLVEEAIAIG